jgi:uncharacterized cupin superfamily protein
MAALGEQYQIGVAIEELPAGMQTAPAHYHILEEEHVYILEGALTLRLGAEKYEMNVGDYVCFPAGQKAGHCLINNSGAPCRYVIVGERNPNEVSVFTDTNKVMVRALGRRTILDLAAVRGYWDGENTGLPAGIVPPAPPVTPEPPVAPKPPISSKNVEWTKEGPGRGTKFGGLSKHLTYAAVGKEYHVGMLIESPAPGQRLCPKHFHMVEEEQALILEGEVTLLLGDERHEMMAGDYVCFPAGRTVGHSFMNSGTGPCSYLMIGSRSPLDVCVYPDSDKLAVNALRTEASIFAMSALRRYWDDEDVG